LFRVLLEPIDSDICPIATNLFELLVNSENDIRLSQWITCFELLFSSDQSEIWSDYNALRYYIMYIISSNKLFVQNGYRRKYFGQCWVLFFENIDQVECPRNSVFTTFISMTKYIFFVQMWPKTYTDIYMLFNQKTLAAKVWPKNSLPKIPWTTKFLDEMHHGPTLL